MTVTLDSFRSGGELRKWNLMTVEFGMPLGYFWTLDAGGPRAT